MELALLEFVIAYERLVYRLHDPTGERDRLLQTVREQVSSNPKRAINVETIAAEYGMSRRHFSRFFRVRTGLTPARVVAQARGQEAARMLLQTNTSLEHIASACGFANSSHFNRVFQRFQHVSPGAYGKRTP